MEVVGKRNKETCAGLKRKLNPMLFAGEVGLRANNCDKRERLRNIERICFLLRKDSSIHGVCRAHLDTALWPPAFIRSGDPLSATSMTSFPRRSQALPCPEAVTCQQDSVTRSRAGGSRKEHGPPVVQAAQKSHDMHSSREG
ncbi:protein cornichon homolog 3 isoform X6 [Bubalus kerabau]|uniref:protein cornichon homolog 3 isoform X6 n=1 Tax=Bubalus carabanensis TaxID=3119969 RepID=UPI00244E7148|nr:protein cornichon homolog 3 isoform X6 [Bubalus carabanensis]